MLWMLELGWCKAVMVLGLALVPYLALDAQTCDGASPPSHAARTRSRRENKYQCFDRFGPHVYEETTGLSEYSTWRCEPC